MKISVVAIVVAAVAGVSATPIPNGQVSSFIAPFPPFANEKDFPCAENRTVDTVYVSPLTHHRPVAALEERASNAIGSFMGFFRRDQGAVPKMQARSPNMGPRKKVEVRVVGRAISLPRHDAADGSRK